MVALAWTPCVTNHEGCSTVPAVDGCAGTVGTAPSLPTVVWIRRKGVMGLWPFPSVLLPPETLEKLRGER